MTLTPDQLALLADRCRARKETMNKTDRSIIALVVFLGLALLAAAIISTLNEREAVAQIEFWRRMYRAADRDAKYVNCVELDDNFVICEKPKR